MILIWFRLLQKIFQETNKARSDKLNESSSNFNRPDNGSFKIAVTDHEKNGYYLFLLFFTNFRFI